MEVFTWIILLLTILMYLEGCVFTSILSNLASGSKLARAVLVMAWPVALPVVCYKIYKQYGEIIQNLLPLLVGGNNKESNI